MPTAYHRRVRDSLSYRITHGLIVFCFGVMIGIAGFVFALLYLDRTDTDIALRNSPSSLPRAKCYSLEKVGIGIWLCIRHS
jgi:hypothetical protein